MGRSMDRRHWPTRNRLKAIQSQIRLLIGVGFFSFTASADRHL
jgi:hypothetical protein